MHILLVSDGGMQRLEKTMLEQGHTVSRFSIPSDLPHGVEGIFGTWVDDLEESDVVILDDKLKRKYTTILRNVNGSAMGCSEVIEKLLSSGLKSESIRDGKIIKRRWWHRNGY